MIAAAMSTLYSLTPVEVLTRLFSATVIGWLPPDGEHHAEQEVVPDLGELPDHAHHDDRRRQRQDDAPEDGEEAGAVDARGFGELGGHGHVEVAEEQRGEGQAVDHVHEDQAGEWSCAMPM